MLEEVRSIREAVAQAEGDPPSAERSISADQPERRVVRQLLEALLCEGLVATRFSPAGGGTSPVYDLKVEALIGGCRFRCRCGRKSFGRFRVEGDSVETFTSGRWAEATLSALLSALPAPHPAKLQLIVELQHTLAILRLNESELERPLQSRRQLPVNELESAIIEGHLYHPCFKTRLGWSNEDHLRYGSEAARSFQLQWVAIRRSGLRSALPAMEDAFWRAELGVDEHQRLYGKLVRQGGSPESHALLPVHPFQLATLTREMAKLSGPPLLLLGPGGDRYRATQSLRTLMNADDPCRAHIKLPLNIICTSSPRNLRPHFVCSAPAISTWLTRLVQEDPFLKTTGLLLLQEYAALAFEPDPSAESTPEAQRAAELIAGKLGVVFRESLVGFLSEDETAVPFTALMLEEQDGRPFIGDWVDQYGIQSWLERLIEVMLIPVWHILVHHGVALEVHAQNLILVHKNGWPERLVVRDFHEATEYVPDYLGQPALAPDLEAIDPYFATAPEDDAYRMASTESLRHLFMDCAFVFNLSDLSFLLERVYGLGESRFWQTVSRSLNSYKQSGVTDPARIAELGAGAAKIVVESLLTKKLHGGGELDYFEHEVDNPLAGLL